MKANRYPDPEFFSSLFRYEGGELIHKTTHARYCGKVAGRTQKAGYKQYIQIKVRGKYYYAHRVIWEMFNGPIPDGIVVDHINGIGTDNRLENLRIVDTIANNRNKRRSNRGSKSGYTGVTFDRKAGRWKAHIEVLGKHKNLGLYDSKEEAYAARRIADEEYGFDPSHGAHLI